MSDKKKLLLIVPTLHQGGQERVAVRTAGLLADVYDITIAIFDDSDIGYDITGLRIENLNVPARRGPVGKGVNIALRKARLAALKSRLHPDISYSFGPSANLINALTATETESTWAGLRNFTDATDVSRMKLCLSHCDRVICCARDIETYVRAKYDVNIPVSTLPNLYNITGIVADAEREEPDEELPTTDEYGRRLRYIGTMGRDDDQKMFWHMLKTFKVVQNEVPEARLIILGSGTFDSYRRMALGLGIEDEVIFAGEQKNPYRYLKYCEIGWMTSRNEGFPNALVEGMALGLATVSTNCMTGPAEILTESGDVYSCTEELSSLSSETKAVYGEYGILTPAMTRIRDMDFAHITEEHFNLAHVMIQLLRDDAMLARYRDAARRRAGDYTYEKYRERFLEMAMTDTGSASRGTAADPASATGDE